MQDSAYSANNLLSQTMSCHSCQFDQLPEVPPQIFKLFPEPTILLYQINGPIIKRVTLRQSQLVN